MNHSPIADDIILVIDELIGKKTKRCGNDLIKDVNDVGLKDVWNDNEILVSETGLIYLLSDQLEKFTPRYKETSGYECCIII